MNQFVYVLGMPRNKLRSSMLVYTRWNKMKLMYEESEKKSWLHFALALFCLQMCPGDLEKIQVGTRHFGNCYATILVNVQAFHTFNSLVIKCVKDKVSRPLTENFYTLDHRFLLSSIARNTI